MKRNNSSRKNRLTVCIANPIYNEVETIPILHDHLGLGLQELPHTLEPPFVDEGSTDETSRIVKEFQRIDRRIKGLSFSAAPLHLVTYFGLTVSILCFLCGLYSSYTYFFTDQTIPGWTSILVTILVLGGVQLVSIGFLGEYLIRVYHEAKVQPIFIIKNPLE